MTSTSTRTADRPEPSAAPGLLDRLPDTSLALLREGYQWAERLRAAHHAEVVRTRLQGRTAVLVRGAADARQFYSDAMRRAGAAPTRLQRTLFGVGGVQGLDGAEHRHRKAMLVGLLDQPQADALAAVLLRRWRERLPVWERADRVRLMPELGDLLTAAVAEWAGVPLPEGDVVCRREQLEALIDAGDGIGPRYRRAVRARRHLERWGAGLVEQVRAGDIHPRPGAALRVVAEHRDLAGELLDARVAAVDLLNVLRPTVAVDRYLVFLALALHEHPAWRERLAAGEEDAVRRVVLEVRRLTPFFPFVAAKAARPLRFDDVEVRPGTRVLLDLHGTNRDPRSWDHPETFDPDRFLGVEPDPFELVPQGGGDHRTGHRCAGEWVTTAVMHAGAALLTREIRYELAPDQDTTVDLRRMPTLPRGGLEITAVCRLA